MANTEDGRRWDSYFRRAGRLALASRAAKNDDAYFAEGAAALLEVMAFVAAPRQGRVLEIGCGDGRMTRTLAGIFESVVAQDVSPAVLNACRANLAAAANVEFVLGSAEALAQYPDESIDFVVSATVFQHIPSCHTVRTYISEASRLLRPHGVAALQLRDPSLRTRARDLAVDVARLPTRLPSFQRNWRGCRIGEADARQAATGQPGRQVGWYLNRPWVWLVIRHDD